ncbi:hypothetical protein [Ramlibacter sp.]|uniref:hypothetical protein n=1 Tax=Ramlibacter sp. TaxID=1917967 RepID=UPI003D1047E6
MSALQLRISDAAYEISVDDTVLARLPGGASTLLAGAGERVRELDVETAIERAEDWLMPSSTSFHAFTLVLPEGAGRLAPWFGSDASVTPEQVECVFNRVVDDVAAGRAAQRDAVADLVVLRELIHHGALTAVVFRS